MRVTLIHNPGAGPAGKETEAGLKALLAAAGHSVRYQSAKEDGWKRALDWPAELVAVAGGDGTVGRVSRRMAGRSVPLGLLPSGTANNIGRVLGLVERPFEELVRGWSNGRQVKLDLGVAEGPWGRRYFVEGVGAGLFATLLASPSREKPDVEQALSDLRSHAACCQPLEIAAQLDGEDISGRYLLMEAVNLPYVGPNLFLAPDAKPGDGQLDVVLVAEAERERLMQYLDCWRENRERLAVLPSHRGRRLRLRWSGFGLHVDDKLLLENAVLPPAGEDWVQVRAGEAAVQFLVPG